MKVGPMTLTLALENVYLQKRNKCSDSLPGTYLADKSDIKEILTQSTVVFAQENIYDVPSRSDITYFGAGPSALHEVIKDAAQALVNYNNTGLGPAEHSHRSDIAATILNEAKADLASYLDISDDYEILFMQGGGSAEFSALDYNSVGAWVARKHREIGGGFDALNSVVKKDPKLDYIITGSWSQKAAAEAERGGCCRVSSIKLGSPR